jgi:superfamily I DNA/RNA helicase
LLELIAPDVEPPLAYRVGADAPLVLRRAPVLEAALEQAARLAAEDGLLAVVAPPSLRDRAGGTWTSPYDETRIPLLTPRESKGLEFDHVVVVEPALIVDDAVAGQGLKELYVALTRPTRTLVVVHDRPLPEPLGS